MLFDAVMTGEIEAVGDIATGALIGRAVEPDAGEGHATGHAHGLCLNCGTALIGDYCHACGQNEHVHRSLGSIGHDLLHGVFHFEGKIWRTLPMLLFHPGALTRRYIAGERARFVSPLALYLFFVFLMFASIHTFGGELDSGLTPAARQNTISNLDKQIAKASTELARLEAASTKAGTTEPSEDVVAMRSTVKALETARMATAAPGSGTTGGHSDLNTGWPALDKGVAKFNANPGLMLYKLQSSAYKYSWALIPISVPFVALLFLWRRRFKLYDHAIFVTYSLCFMMLLVTVFSLGLTVNVPGGWLTALLLIAPPVHMFAQLRGAYSLRKRSALWRTVMLMTFSLFALILWGMLLLALGLTS